MRTRLFPFAQRLRLLGDGADSVFGGARSVAGVIAIGLVNLWRQQESSTRRIVGARRQPPERRNENSDREKSTHDAVTEPCSRPRHRTPAVRRWRQVTYRGFRRAVLKCPWI